MNCYVNGETRAMTQAEQAEHEAMIRPTAAERIEELKRLLSETDYKTLKYAEGALDAQEFAAACAIRAEWRRQINELEESAANG